MPSQALTHLTFFFNQFFGLLKGTFKNIDVAQSLMLAWAVTNVFWSIVAIFFASKDPVELAVRLAEPHADLAHHQQMP